MFRPRLLSALLLTACGPASLRVVMDQENNSGQKGFALLTSLSKASTRVEVDIGASNDARPQPAHIHEGRCGEIGVIKAGLSNLAPDPKRPDHFVSTTEVAVGLDALLAGTYAINVHDVRDTALYVSCGQLHE